MSSESLLLAARRAAGLSQGVLAGRAGTSRPTLSAYEHGRKSPSLSTAERILAEAGFELTLRPRVEFVERVGERGRTIEVPTSLPRLTVEEALASVVLPLHLNWSAPERRFDLRDRRDRARVYELVLREGTPDDVLVYVDGALLIDLWDDLVLPGEVRSAWAPVVAGHPAEPPAIQSQPEPVDAYSCAMSRLERITSLPDVCHGQPTIRGLRYPVQMLLELLSSGMTIDDVLVDYPDLERDDLLAALEFGALASGGRQVFPLGA